MKYSITTKKKIMNVLEAIDLADKQIKAEGVLIPELSKYMLKARKDLKEILDQCPNEKRDELHE